MLLLQQNLLDLAVFEVEVVPELFRDPLCARSPVRLVVVLGVLRFSVLRASLKGPRQIEGLALLYQIQQMDVGAFHARVL